MSAAAEQNRRDLRRERYAALHTLRGITSLKRIKACGAPLPDGHIQFRVTETPDGRRAGVAGTMHCGSTWACPVCSATILNRRASQITNAMNTWRDRFSGSILMVTLTMRHKRGQDLSSLWDSLSVAWTAASRFTETEREELGTYLELPRGDDTTRPGWRIPYIRVPEATYSPKTGWHLHIHSLIFVRHLADESDKARAMALGYNMIQRWGKTLATRGQGKISIAAQDVHIVYGQTNALGEYLAKAAYEAVGGAAKQARSKGSYTPFQILARLAHTGTSADLTPAQNRSWKRIWKQWEQASRGRRQIQTSFALWRLLHTEDITDEEIVEEDQGGDNIASITSDLYSTIRRRNALPPILDAYETSNLLGHALLESLARTWGFPPDTVRRLRT